LAVRQDCFNHEWTRKASSTDYAMWANALVFWGMRGREFGY